MHGKNGEQGDVLYHGASILNLIGILNENVIRDDLGDDNFHSGVSFSRSIAQARKFAGDSEDFALYREGFDAPEFGRSDGCVIAMDREFLSKGAGLKDVKWDGVATEREERTIGPVHNPMKGIVAIYASERDLDWYRQLVEDYEMPGHVERWLDWLKGSELLRAKDHQDHVAETEEAASDQNSQLGP
jgi:hypothetical protein